MKKHQKILKYKQQSFAKSCWVGKCPTVTQKGGPISVKPKTVLGLALIISGTFCSTDINAITELFFVHY